MESFPDPVLTQILAGVPGGELVLVCRLVCRRWKGIVDGAEIWRMKCRREGLAETARDAERGGWKTSYFLHRRKRNLIRNQSAEEDLDSWEVVASGGDGWSVEELPGDNGRDFPIEGIRKYFATSFEWCSKAQVIDLLHEGYWEELLDTEQPDIVINDWYAARTDAGSLYELCAQLLSDDHQVITEYKSEMISIPQSDEGEWTQISHTFSGYGPGVRYVRFQHGGQDSVFWKGWFGVRVTNSSVTIEP